MVCTFAPNRQISMLEEITSLFKDIYSWKFWLICCLILVWIVQMCYYLGVFVRIRRKPKAKQYLSPVPVSVVICARNEAANLREKLPAVLEQDYPDFEVIVVNDSSTDDSALVLAELKQKYPKLYVTEVPFDRKFSHGKKLALTVGIKAAKNEWLLLTDADCMPVSKWWIKTMSQNFSDQNDIVLGYGGYNQRKGFLNRLIRYDTVFIAMQYYTYTDIGMPYMGVGRNMAYRKSLFEKTRGFSSHSYLMSGDDDLFVNERANKRNTRIVTTKSSIVESIPCETFQEWVKQKKRHLSTWTHYRFGTKIVLSYELMSRLLFYAALLVAVICFGLYIEAAAAYGFRLIIQLIVYKLNMCKFGERGFWFLIPIFDLVLPLLQLAFNILNLRDSRSR